MIGINEILQQLGEMGFTGAQGGYGGISHITQPDILQRMEEMYDLGGMLDPSMFQTIGPSELSSALSKTYSPQLESQGGSLLSKLLQATSGEVGKRAGGGFAGSGQYSSFLGQAKDIYGKGMSEILTNIGMQKSQATQGIMDKISDWKQQALAIQGQGGQV